MVVFNIMTKIFREDADYQFVGDDGSIYADFVLIKSEETGKKGLKLIGISFDGYGHCSCKDKRTTVMDTKNTKCLIDATENDTIKVTEILIFYLRTNVKHLWEDALESYKIL